MEPLISLQNVVKSYRAMRALDGVSLDILPGITGLLGPNGAGKSTLIKLILGLVNYQSGNGTVLGYELGRSGRQIRSRIGYMPEDDCYIPGMTGVEVVQFSACLSGLPEVEALRRAHEILDFCGMKQERYRAIDTFSTGMRQKTRFAAAIVHDPDFLILDEPTSGLDPEERDALLNRIRLLNRQAGKSILVSTHILPDVQAICENVLILAAGKIVLHDRLANLNRTASPTVFVRVLGDAATLINELQSSGQTVSITLDGAIAVEGEKEAATDAIWAAAAKTGTVVRSLLPALNSLEEIFLATVRESQHAHA